MLISMNTVYNRLDNYIETSSIDETKQELLKKNFFSTNLNDQSNTISSLFGISKYYQYSIFINTFQCPYTRILETPT